MMSCIQGRMNAGSGCSRYRLAAVPLMWLYIFWECFLRIPRQWGTAKIMDWCCHSCWPYQFFVCRYLRGVNLHVVFSSPVNTFALSRDKDPAFALSDQNNASFALVVLPHVGPLQWARRPTHTLSTPARPSIYLCVYALCQFSPYRNFNKERIGFL